MKQPKMLFSVLILVMLLAITLVTSGQLALGSPPSQEGSEETPAAPSAGLTEEQQAALDAAARLAAIQFPALDEVRRGCPACHTLVDPETGRYTLAFEAAERVEARGREHPTMAPSGASITPVDDVSVTVCLECHAAGTGDRAARGVIAPLSLRDIVHPAHMSSQYFKLHYGGSCFTCHNVNGEGEWELLTQKVDVNEKGVPNPDLMPIPGAEPISP